MEVKIEVNCSDFCLDFRLLNDKHQNNLKLKLFDIPHSNDERENDLTVKLFDV